MSKGEVIVKNIVIKIGEKEIELNLDEARELQEVLNDVLGKDIEVVKEVIHHYPYTWWNVQPYRWDGVGTPQWESGTILCSAANINKF